ncbi:MAG: hypothetical protein ACOY94_03845 [Bacillota bacterium]
MDEALEILLCWLRQLTVTWEPLLQPQTAFDGWATTVILGVLVWYWTERAPSLQARRRVFEIMTKEMIFNLSLISKEMPNQISLRIYETIGGDALVYLDAEAGEGLMLIIATFKHIRDNFSNGNKIHFESQSINVLNEAFNAFLDGCGWLPKRRRQEHRDIPLLT